MGPPADFIEAPVDVTDAGEPVFLVGVHEAAQSDNWRPLGKVAAKVLTETPSGVIEVPIEAAEPADTADSNPPSDDKKGDA